MDEPTTTPEPTAAPETVTPSPDPAPAAQMTPSPEQSLATQAAEQAEIARSAAATAMQARDLGLAQGKVLEQTTAAHAAELSKLVALREEIEAERNAVKAERALSARIEYLRAAGLRDDLPAAAVADLRQTVPDVDAATPEGKRKLDEWRAARLGFYFREVESPTEAAARQAQVNGRAAALAEKSPIIGELLGRHLRRVK